MTNTYKTGNPLGSSSPKDLSDNASNFDEGLNSTSPSFVDRFGKRRQTWAGFEAAVAQSLIDSGYTYTNPLNYQAGIVITRANQIFLKDGEYYRTGPTITLPYTTTGNWTVEGPLMRSVGDAVLRSQFGGDNGADNIGFGAGANRRPLSNKLRDITSVRDYGAKGDGATNDTAAIAAALATGANIYFPPGVYLFDSIQITKEGQRVYGEGMNTVLKSTSALLNVGIYVKGLRIKLDDFRVDTTLAGAEAIAVYVDSGSAEIEVTSVRANGGNRISFYAANSIDVRFVNCYSDQARDTGFQFYRCTRAEALYCQSFNVQNQHGFQDNEGTRCKFFNCKATNCGIFGINGYESYATSITNCTVWNTHKEGINVEGASRFLIANNDVWWTEDNVLPSEDFGISIFGNANATPQTQANHGIVSNNRVTNSGKSGIALAQNVQLCVVEGNNILNCNKIGESFAAAILLYGGGCRNNTVQGNVYFDSGGYSPFAFAEGTGDVGDFATANRFHGNDGFGFSQKMMNLQPGSMQALNTDGFVPYTVTCTGLTGDLGGYTAAGAIEENNKVVRFAITVTITAQGTANGGIAVSLPYPNSTISTGCSGRDGLTGKALTGVISGGSTFIAVRFYDNGAPVATGSVLTLWGEYQKA